MNKTAKRLLMFAILAPSIIALVWFFPQYDHLAANAVLVLASSLGAMEFSNMLSHRYSSLPLWEAAILGAVVPFTTLLRVSFDLSGTWEFHVITTAILWVLASRVLARNKELDTVLERLATAFSVIVYPGLLLAWAIRINVLPNASIIFIVFLFLVFGNDSLAWVFGMWLGEGNRGIIPASPNKSIAGFIGGIAASIGFSLAAVYLFPDVFQPKMFSPFVSGFILGFTTGTGAIIGDLAESTIKRSAAMKDSGTIIPGRGGILDSVDSLAYAAPIFLSVFRILFKA